MKKPATTAHRADTPLVLLHGLGFSAAYWRPQLKALGERRRVLAWTMPGHGGTPALPQMTFRTLCEGLRQFLDQSGISKAHLLGHSMGGMLALEFAATHPARVKTLTLFGASAAFPPPESEFTKSFVRTHLAPLDRGGAMADVAEDTIARHLGPGADPIAAKIIRECMVTCPPDVYRQSLACLATFDRRAALTGLAMPVLVLAAERDINAPPAGVEKMAAKIPGAEYHCFAGAGHFANIEKARDFNPVVADFLTRHAEAEPD